MQRFTTSLFCFLLFTLKSQLIDTNWLKQNYTKEEVMITMRDGVKLFTCIYAPRDISEKHPVLMMRTPYSVSPYGANIFSPRLYKTHWVNYLKENYILVLQDVRGAYMSEGTFVDVRPYLKFHNTPSEIDESTDAFDTMEWLIKNLKHTNGNIGVFGISYPGFYATMAALSGHPSLKAVSPQAPVTDWFMGDDFHHNGAFALADGFSFYSGFGRPRPVPTTVHKSSFPIKEKDNYQFFLSQGPIKNLSKLLGDSILFWNELMIHPNYDDWWKARDARRACTDVKPAILVVGGNFDAEDCFGAYNLYKAIETQSPKTSNKLVMGPWFHGGWGRSDGSNLGNVRFAEKTSRYYQKEIELKFFNYYLKGQGDVSEIAEANIFFSGENKWYSLNNWPPKDIKAKQLYLKENSKLSFEKPANNSSFSSYISDPSKPVPYTDGIHAERTREYMTDDQRFASKRPDVLVFETEILEENLSLAGPVIADLKVKLSTSDADFVVKLIDVFPENFKYDSTFCCRGIEKESEMGGYQMLVRAEIMRGKFRNSFEKPEAFDTTIIETVKFTLPDVAHTFLKGHKLMIQIQSSWFPLFDRNPQQFTDIYHCSEKDFKRSEIRIFHQENAASCVQLPLIKHE